MSAMRVRVGAVLAAGAILVCGCGGDERSAAAPVEASVAAEGTAPEATGPGATAEPEQAQAAWDAGAAVAATEDNPDPAAARRAAIEQAQRAGVLGQLKSEGGAFASITGTGELGSGLDDANIYGGLLGDEVGEMTGGFGFGAGGSGGGGTGEGTIGLGNYGTIGRGTGSGSGYGRPRPAPPRLQLGIPVLTGGLDENIVRRYVRRQLPRLRYCYEKQLVAKPTLAGEVEAQFAITGAGDVTGARATGVDATVASCIADTLATIKFPKPKGPGTVRYGFVLKLPEASGAAASGAAGPSK